MSLPDQQIIYTIGHSTHPYDEFVQLVRPYHIQTLVDVRSKPQSRFPQFNRAFLEKTLPKDHINYVFLGNELGGHPTADDQYDSEGHALYERLSKTKDFGRGVKQLLDMASNTGLVIMCAEGNPAECHRHPLLSRVLLERMVKVVHILRDGSTQEAADLFAQTTTAPPQLPLMEPPGEDLSWRSPKKIR